MTENWSFRKDLKIRSGEIGQIPLDEYPRYFRTKECPSCKKEFEAYSPATKYCEKCRPFLYQLVYKKKYKKIRGKERPFNVKDEPIPEVFRGKHEWFYLLARAIIENAKKDAESDTSKIKGKYHLKEAEKVKREAIDFLFFRNKPSQELMERLLEITKDDILKIRKDVRKKLRRVA